ncbi:hypothetical protein Zm00014a_011328 [Zea mays]|uniref:Uncharacterized protein n=2 Tax=Zea mays TaxID=4577 RepID=K7VFF0_MAIZE|nr:uncharacterized protein LOC100276160 [Zea mays]AQL02390.1 hypothetical protein ZEAMMB73_Zm00001d045489 [Zea mays]PWZ06144.1 hypothetical protein Zm00014a_011328 [Zea mays]
MAALWSMLICVKEKIMYPCFDANARHGTVVDTSSWPPCSMFNTASGAAVTLYPCSRYRRTATETVFQGKRTHLINVVVTAVIAWHQRRKQNSTAKSEQIGKYGHGSSRHCVGLGGG